MFKIKIFKYLSVKRLLALGALIILLILSLTGPLQADTAQSYHTDQTLQKGMILVIDKNDPSKVRAATRDTTDRIYGVAANLGAVPAPLSGEKQEVMVSTSGRNSILVSDQNGVINSGDYVILSNVAGVGMKAGSDYEVIVGKALDKFDGQSGVIAKTQYQTGSVTKTVNLGYITADVAIGFNPLADQGSVANFPALLKKAGTTVAQKPVTTTRAYAAFVVLIIAAITTVTMLYSGIRNSLIAVGRNPLSKSSIISGLIRVIIVSLGVFVIGLIAVYLLLRL